MPIDGVTPTLPIVISTGSGTPDVLTGSVGLDTTHPSIDIPLSADAIIGVNDGINQIGRAHV